MSLLDLWVLFGVLFRLLLRMFNGGKVFGRFWCAANMLSNQTCYPGSMPVY